MTQRSTQCFTGTFQPGDLATTEGKGMLHRKGVSVATKWRILSMEDGSRATQHKGKSQSQTSAKLE